MDYNDQPIQIKCLHWFATVSTAHSSFLHVSSFGLIDSRLTPRKSLENNLYIVMTAVANE